MVQSERKDKAPARPVVGKYRWLHRAMGCMVLLLALFFSILVFNFVCDFGSRTFGWKKIPFMAGQEQARSAKKVGRGMVDLLSSSLDVERNNRGSSVYDDPKAVLGRSSSRDKARAASLRDLFRTDPDFSGCTIKVEVSGSRATLTGTVTRPDLVKRAERVVLATGTVKRVISALVVKQ